MRKFVAVALALSLLTSCISGCSQPIDNGSSVPAQSQPIVALLALIGLGIGLTAWHHHNEHHSGGGTGGNITAPAVVVAPFITGFTPVDLSPDTAGNGGAGDLGLLLTPSASGTGRYAEVFVTTGGSGTVAQSAGSYTLPTGYQPAAVAVDPNGNAWFDDHSGKVYECGPLTSGVTTCSVLAGPFTDGLPVGARSIGADGNLLFVVEDGGGGKVDWAYLPTNPIGTSFTTGSYQSSSTASIFAADAVDSTPPTSGGSGYSVYHQSGASDIVTFPVSGSSVTVSAAISFTFTPLPLEAPSNFINDTVSSTGAFFALTGSTTGTYQITRYSSAANSGLGALPALSRTIAINGVTGGGAFTLPLIALHADAPESILWAIDSRGNVVGFTEF